MGMTTSVIQRKIGGYRYRSFVAEEDGLSYEFDPVKQAMKDAGITELNPAAWKRLAGKILQFHKTGRIGAQTGLKFKKLARDIPDPEERAAYAGRWRRSLILRLTSASKSLVSFLTNSNSLLRDEISLAISRNSGDKVKYSSRTETSSALNNCPCCSALYRNSSKTISGSSTSIFFISVIAPLLAGKRLWLIRVYHREGLFLTGAEK
jgi:hypothetical protein